MPAHTRSHLHVSALAVRPVKSMRGVEVARMPLDRLGPRGDRRWMVVDDAGSTLTAREVPTMLGLTARPLAGAVEHGAFEHGAVEHSAVEHGAVEHGAFEHGAFEHSAFEHSAFEHSAFEHSAIEHGAIEHSAIELSAPGLDPVVVHEPHDGPRVAVTLSRVGWATGCPAHVDHWLSRALARPARLVWLDDPERRSVSANHGGRPGDPLSLADAAPVLLTTSASLAALNTWLADEQGHEPLPMERFRPTLVVDGDLEPFAEDGWQRVRVGDVVLRFAERCDRCVMTTVDLATLRTGAEPTRTLARHRRRDGKVWFGVRLVPEAVGEIAVGDPVVPLR